MKRDRVGNIDALVPRGIYFIQICIAFLHKFAYDKVAEPSHFI